MEEDEPPRAEPAMRLHEPDPRRLQPVRSGSGHQVANQWCSGLPITGTSLVKPWSGICQSLVTQLPINGHSMVNHMSINGRPVAHAWPLIGQSVAGHWSITDQIAGHGQSLVNQMPHNESDKGPTGWWGGAHPPGAGRGPRPCAGRWRRCAGSAGAMADAGSK